MVRITDRITISPANANTARSEVILYFLIRMGAKSAVCEFGFVVMKMRLENQEECEGR